MFIWRQGEEVIRNISRQVEEFAQALYLMNADVEYISVLDVRWRVKVTKIKERVVIEFTIWISILQQV